MYNASTGCRAGTLTLKISRGVAVPTAEAPPVNMLCTTVQISTRINGTSIMSFSCWFPARLTRFKPNSEQCHRRKLD